MEEDCREKIVSEDYVDIIWRLVYDVQNLEKMYPGSCIQLLNEVYGVFYVSMDALQAYGELRFSYDVFPSLYTLQENEDLDASGILAIQNQPVLRLQGEGVILGMIDTGIDYTNRCFQNRDGSTRILAIWDQEDQSGTLPEGISYGSVYTREQINEALASEDPYAVVPSRDVLGHGTQLASVAGGSLDEATGWIGAAPKADLAVVKLKPAKKYLKRYFAVPEEAIAFQENDIMLAVRYLGELAFRERKPLVICIGLGSNMGGHEGTSPLSTFLNRLSTRIGCCVVVAGGNETNQGHHFYGSISEGQSYEDVELRVAENEFGLMMEFWSTAPDLFSLSITSPTGEEIPRMAPNSGSHRYQFLFERTIVYIDFQTLDPYTGEQFIVIRMFSPTPGIWRLRIYGANVFQGTYNIWLPVTGFISEGTVFLNSNPDITLTEPGNTELPITVAAYQVQNGSIYINSSRGYTRKGRIKPDLAAPGVSVAAYAPGNRLTSMTGTSPAAAITAGASALMLEWGIVRKNRINMATPDIKQILIRGAKRSPSQTYPNRSWGYGTLDLYTSFLSLGRF